MSKSVEREERKKKKIYIYSSFFSPQEENAFEGNISMFDDLLLSKSYSSRRQLALMHVWVFSATLSAAAFSSEV